jgi:glutaredoxin
MARFAGLNTQVLGVSVDHVPCLVAWADSLGGISYPLLSDFWPHGAVAQRFGVLREDGFTERALFIIDRDGVVRYSEVVDLGTQPDNDELLARIREIDPEAAAEADRFADFQLPSGGTVLYCSRFCPDCRKARSWLKERGIAYTEVDVNSIPGAGARVREWAGGKLITPTFDIDGTIIVNFDEEKLTQALGL